MPPRKKSASTAADGAAPTRATRSSARTKAPVSAATAAAPASKPPSTASKPPSAAKAPAKTKGKRARDDTIDEEDEDEAKKPAKKKAKASNDAGDAKDDTKDDAKDDKDDTKDDKNDPPKKMVKIIKRGAAPVDEHSGLTGSHQVLETSEVWDCMLNQTDLGKNANKFYVIQVLHPIGNTQSCTLFTRWGRVGERGQQAQKHFSQSVAINEFKKTFKSKTATDWSGRVGMTTKKGKYTWIERSFGDDEDDDQDKSSGASGSKEPEKIPDSKLESSLQDFVKLIFNSQFVSAALSEMNYDANKLPLGKLAKSTILNGFTALKELSEVINNPNGTAAQGFGGFAAACRELSGRYYSIIPHSFGRNIPTSINNTVLLKRELDLVDALGEMQIAQKLIQSSIPQDEQGNPINPLDAQFLSLGLTSMTEVDRMTKEFGALDKYTQETHGHTHSHYKVHIQHAFRVDRAAETEAWSKGGFDSLADGERMLLWHGSRSTNFAGILKQGLRIAPPEAPVTGYMFGKGVYFADMMSKSANYCYSHLSDGVGCLLLCEVAARPFHELKDSDYHADQSCKKNKKLATKGIGRTAPTKWQDAGEALDNPLLKGVTMPAGPGEDVSAQNPGAYLQYNEYIVYDVSQIKLRYLLMVKLH